MGPGKPQESSKERFPNSLSVRSTYFVNFVCVIIIHAAVSTALRELTSHAQGQLKVEISIVDQVMPSKWCDSLYKTMRRQQTLSRIV